MRVDHRLVAVLHWLGQVGQVLRPIFGFHKMHEVDAGADLHKAAVQSAQSVGRQFLHLSQTLAGIRKLDAFLFSGTNTSDVNVFPDANVPGSPQLLRLGILKSPLSHRFEISSMARRVSCLGSECTSRRRTVPCAASYLR